MDTRAWTKQQLEARGFAVLDSRSNFLFASPPTEKTAANFTKVKEKGVLVRHFDAPRIQNWLRITIGTPEQMQTFCGRWIKLWRNEPCGEVTLERNTNETQIELTLNWTAPAAIEVDTGCGFLNHMLELFARHGRFDLVLTCHGDVEVDYHHTTEDVGIALGQAFARALGDMRGHPPVRQLLSAHGRSAHPLRRRPFGPLHPELGRPLQTEKVGDFDVECAKEFWLGFARSVPATVHFVQFAGENTHHILEACFKGAGRALAAAVAHRCSPPGRDSFHERTAGMIASSITAWATCSA